MTPKPDDLDALMVLAEKATTCSCLPDGFCDHLDDFHAACDPATVKALIERVRRAEDALRDLTRFDCDYDCTANIGDPIRGLDRCDCFRSFARNALTPEAPRD